MEEARKLDHMLLELKSATGKIKVDSLVAMHPLKSVQEERKELLKSLIADDLVGCTEEALNDESDVWLTEVGEKFLANGGYRKRKAPEKDREQKKAGDRIRQILLYAIPLIVLIVLLLVLFKVIG